MTSVIFVRLTDAGQLVLSVFLVKKQQVPVHHHDASPTAAWTYLAEGHHLLADGALVGEELESRGKVAAQLHRLLDISRAEALPLQGQQAPEHGCLVPGDYIWDWSLREKTQKKSSNCFLIA